MNSPSLRSTLALAFVSALFGCSATDGGTNAVAASEKLSGEKPEAVVRAYYAASRSDDVAGALEGITADDIVLEAPSVLILNPLGHTDEVHGKAAFIKAIRGGAFLLKTAIVAPAGAPNDPESGVAMSVMTPEGVSPALVVSRIQLPLPNGDLLTQAEFFEVEDGKILHMQSYYDGSRFIQALPEIAVAKLKDALSQ